MVNQIFQNVPFSSPINFENTTGYYKVASAALNALKKIPKAIASEVSLLVGRIRWKSINDILKKDVENGLFDPKKAETYKSQFTQSGQTYLAKKLDPTQDSATADQHRLGSIELVGSKTIIGRIDRKKDSIEEQNKKQFMRSINQPMYKHLEQTVLNQTFMSYISQVLGEATGSINLDTGIVTRCSKYFAEFQPQSNRKILQKITIENEIISFLPNTPSLGTQKATFLVTHAKEGKIESIEILNYSKSDN